MHTQVVFGTRQSVDAALRESSASRTINTSFLERHNATDRHRNARKQRRTYRFSKDWRIHESVGYLSAQYRRLAGLCGHAVPHWMSYACLACRIGGSEWGRPGI